MVSSAVSPPSQLNGSKTPKKDVSITYTIRSLHWDYDSDLETWESTTVYGDFVVFKLPLDKGYELDFSSFAGYEHDKSLGTFLTFDEAEQFANKYHVKELEKFWLVKHVKA